jgi:hypothetical protein
MLLISIFIFIYVGSLAACAHIMIERNIEPNPISIFIVFCPIVNLIYTICRSKGNWKNWFKNL